MWKPNYDFNQINYKYLQFVLNVRFLVSSEKLLNLFIHRKKRSINKIFKLPILVHYDEK